jgi:peptidoglycan/xylan/chitin deacetylase (PgdA/CDA1 family)
VLAEGLAVTVGGAAVAAMTHAVRGPSSSLLGPSVHRGSTGRRALALTFDDGPSEGTEEILAILQRFKVSATFFQCGMNVLRLPDVARAVVREGHEIGNHTHSHARLYFRSRQTIEREMSCAQEAIEATLGLRPTLMRPPFGVRWFGFREAQNKLGLLGVMWTVIALDWKLKSEAITRRIVRGASNGAILCLHDGRELQPKPNVTETTRALRETIPALQDRGYHFETVSQILCPTN